MSNKLTSEQLLELVESIVSDDFCEDLSCVVAMEFERSPEETRAMLEEASKKLTDIYIAVHGHNENSSCHAFHETWRKEAIQMYDKLSKKL